MNKKSTSVAEMRIDEDGFLCITVLSGTIVTGANLREYFMEGNRLLQRKTALVLLDVGTRSTFTREARLLACGTEVLNNRVAIAIVTDSFRSRILFAGMRRSAVPVKTFSSRARAAAWLRTFYILPGQEFARSKKKKNE